MIHVCSIRYTWFNIEALSLFPAATIVWVLLFSLTCVGHYAPDFTQVATAFWRFWPQLMVQILTISSWSINNLKEFSKANMLHDHVWNAHCSRSMFSICSWSIFNLEYSSRLLMVHDHTVKGHMVLDHKSRSKSQKSVAKHHAIPQLCVKVIVIATTSWATILWVHHTDGLYCYWKWQCIQNTSTWWVPSILIQFV